MRVFETICRSMLPTFAAFALFGGASLKAQTITFNDSEARGSNLGYDSPEAPAGSLNSHSCRWGGQSISNGFAGFNWNGLAAVDLQDYLYSDQQQKWGRCFVNGRTNFATGNKLYNITDNQSRTGYQQQLLQEESKINTNVLAVSGGTTASFSRSQSFVLESMLLGAGWGNVSRLSVMGLLDGRPQWFDSFSFLGLGGAASTLATTELVGGSKSINQVMFSAEYSGAGANFDPYNTLGEQGIGGYWEANPSRYATFWVDNVTFREAPPTVVPEPSTYALMAAGLAALGIAARRRKRA